MKNLKTIIDKTNLRRLFQINLFRLLMFILNLVRSKVKVFRQGSLEYQIPVKSKVESWH